MSKEEIEKAPDYKETGLLENIHYYREDDRVIFTSLFHLQRGSCCGNGCRKCPYTKPHIRGNKNLEITKD